MVGQMTSKTIQVYGAGISGLVAAIQCARKGIDVTVYEKEPKIGGSTSCHPSVHMTPMHLAQMEEHLDIELKSCFSPVESFRGYLGDKTYVFSPENLYVVERGPRRTSLDFFLYQKALKEGVTVEFSHPLTREALKEIPDGSIIATAGYSQLVEALHLPYLLFKQYDTHQKTDHKNSTIAYFGEFTSDYGYVSIKDGLLSAQLSGPGNLSEKNLQRFTALVKKTEGIDLTAWSSLRSSFPKKARRHASYAGKTFVLAGDVAGFLDPFFGFGITGALISGKIAAVSLLSEQKASAEFARFASHLQRNLVVHTLYWHLPLKRLILSPLMRVQKNHFSFLKRSIPGFADDEWVKIISVTE
jgi:flavin-dependent dehydrogenase